MISSAQREQLGSDAIFAEHPVALVADGGLRTPFAKAPGKLADYTLLDLGQRVVQRLIERLKLDPHEIDELVFGTVLFNPLDSNFARHLVLRAGLPRNTYAFAVSNNCITSLVAIDVLARDIASGRANIGIAGGSESMSNVTLPMPPGAHAFWRRLSTAKTMGQKLGALATFRPHYLVPQRPQPIEPFTGKTMGEHCEETNREFQISREVQDDIALRSHRNAARAAAEGILNAEIAPLDDLATDTGIRPDTSREALAKLRPIFDQSEHGTITAGNASFPTDGAAAVCLMSAVAVEQQGRKPIAWLRGIGFAAIDPDDGLLMAPALALPRLLARHKLTAADIGLFEIHEAFAAQIAANVHVWEHGWPKYPEIRPIGSIDWARVNVNGGSLAIGHPFAATGARLVTSLANELQRRQLRWGVVSACAAGGAGCAMLLENAAL